MEKVREIDWNEIRSEIGKRATSATARESILSLSPCENPEEATNEMRKSLLALNALKEGHRPQLESIDHFYVWFERVKKGASLKPIDFKDVRQFCLSILDVSELTKTKNEWTQSLIDELANADNILAAIDQIITESGDIRTDASETLFKLFNDKNSLEREIQKTLDRIVKDHSIENVLQDKYVTTRDGRWVLPVKSGMRSGIQGIIHDISQSKQTVFMEPQAVVEVNNKLRQVLSGIDEEVERVLQSLSQFIESRSDELKRSFELLSDADKTLAVAAFSDEIDASDFEFSETLQLDELRHPLLSIQLGTEVVPNDFRLPEGKNVLVLSGPNAGGKTVLLKAIGLAAQMARCGLPICARKGAKIPFFKNILVDVGDSQSVGENLSTFAAHVKMLGEASQFSGSENLILIDEICGSTDPEEGAALARSFVEHFAKQKVISVITSHLGPLKQGWDENSSVVSGSMEYDEKSSRPTYELVLGVHGRSLAIKTARVVGIDQKILHRALSFLDPEVKKRELKLDELEDMRQELIKLRNELKTERSVVKQQKEKYRRLINEIQVKKDEWLQKAIEKAQDKIDKTIRQSKREKVQVDFKSFKAQFPKIKKSTGEAGPVEVTDLADFKQKAPPGTKVFVGSLKQSGIVQSEVNSKGEVVVLSQSMRLTLPWTDLTVEREPPKNKNESTSVRDIFLSGGVHEIDLRGFKVDEALSRLEDELDQALLKGLDRVKVIHGHGTEALKKAIRAFLSRSVYVKKWTSGENDGDSDGTTVVEI